MSIWILYFDKLSICLAKTYLYFFSVFRSIPSYLLRYHLAILSPLSCITNFFLYWKLFLPTNMLFFLPLKKKKKCVSFYLTFCSSNYAINGVLQTCCPYLCYLRFLSFHFSFEALPIRALTHPSSESAHVKVTGSFYTFYSMVSSQSSFLYNRQQHLTQWSLSPFWNISFCSWYTFISLVAALYFLRCFFFFFLSFPWTLFFLSMLTPLVIQSSIMDLNNHLFFDDYQMFVSILDLSSELYTNDAAACFISLLCLICMLELNMNLNILIFLLTPSNQFLSVFCILIAASSFQGLRTEIFESSLPSLFLLNFTSNLSQFWLYLRYLP